MSETKETTTDSAIGAPMVSAADHRDRRLRHVLAWVGIAAGVVFIVAVVFFSGFALGRGSDGYHGWHRGYQSQMGPGGGCPMMRNGGMGPGGMGPGGMDDMRPGVMRPGQSSASPSPAPPAR
jgi:hypothetical protein